MNYQKTETRIDFHLLNSKWGQNGNNSIDFRCGRFDDPYYGAYNKFIPQNNINCGCDKCTAGCTGIATSQILNYWKYPAYTDKRQYDWENIEDSLLNTSSFAQIDATAHLIADCAEYINSNFCSDGCETTGNLLSARNSFVSDFNYNNNADFRKRIDTKKWKIRILDDLEQGFPVLYGAAENFWGNGAHAYVCDGYDYDDDFFHFNFGWNGNDDAYYDIDAILNYDIWHWAVFNISPEYYYGCSETIDLGNWYDQNSDAQPLLDQPWAGIVFTADESYPLEYRTVYSDDNVNIHAYNNIVLRQGFSVQSGGEFHAYLTDCPEQKTPKKQNFTDNSNDGTNPQIEYLSNLELNISPNPTSNSAKISYFLPQTTDYSIEIYDIFGKKLKQIENNNKNEGNYEIFVDLSFLQNGVYFCVLKTSQGVVSKKIVKM